MEEKEGSERSPDCPEQNASYATDACDQGMGANVERSPALLREISEEPGSGIDRVAEEGGEEKSRERRVDEEEEDERGGGDAGGSERGTARGRVPKTPEEGDEEEEEERKQLVDGEREVEGRKRGDPHQETVEREDALSDRGDGLEQREESLDRGGPGEIEGSEKSEELQMVGQYLEEDCEDRLGFEDCSQGCSDKSEEEEEEEKTGSKQEEDVLPEGGTARALEL